MATITPNTENFSAQSLDTFKEKTGSDSNDILLGTTDIHSPVGKEVSDAFMLASDDVNTNASHTAVTDYQTGTSHDVLDIRDLISNHATPDNVGGYLQFTVNNGAVTLGIDLSSADGSGNSTYVALASIEGVSGLSATQIMNTLLANHEIKFD